MAIVTVPMTLCMWPSCAISRTPPLAVNTATAAITTENRLVISLSCSVSSEPQPQTSDEPRTVRVFACGFRKISGPAELVVPGHAAVRCELAPEFIPQSKAGLRRAQAGSNTAVGIRSPEDLALQQRLQD